MPLMHECLVRLGAAYVQMQTQEAEKIERTQRPPHPKGLTKS